MDHRQLAKNHSELFKLWVREKFRFGGDPTPQKGKNYILVTVSEAKHCFVLIEYNDNWKIGNGEKNNVERQNIPSREIISYNGSKTIKDREVHITDTGYIALLTNIIEIFSTEKLNNQLVVCCRTNGTGRVVFDSLKKEMASSSENVRFFPTIRRSGNGKELFSDLQKGWEMSSAEEELSWEAMRTAIHQEYFSLSTDLSRQTFDRASTNEHVMVEPYTYCWLMLSFIRYNSIILF